LAQAVALSFAFVIEERVLPAVCAGIVPIPRWFSSLL